MCGIAGYFGHSLPLNDRLQSASRSISHRGPDGEGFYTHHGLRGQSVAFVHRRLAIINLDPRANQPFRVDNKILILNGEIYNYLELRVQLKSLGHHFHTTSDTEVLAKALLQWGLDAQKRLEGMWAFAWYDEGTGELLLSRDRFGEKPLFYYESDGQIYFASEPKAIFALLGRTLPINLTQIRRYLVNGYKSLYKGQDTFFEELKEVPAGSYIIYSSSNPRKVFYWRGNFNQQNEKLSFNESVEAVRTALIRSVELRLRADVPIAFCLSGGVDSNALISIAARRLGYNVHGFTVMNTDLRYEEREFVELSVNELGLRHTAIPLTTEGFLSNLRSLIRGHDAPVYTITYYAQWRLMEAVKAAGYKVSVSGSAADELFTGYFDHHLAYLAVIKNLDRILHDNSLINWQTYVQPFVRNLYLQNPNYLIDDPTRRDHIFLDAEIFSSMLKEPFNEAFRENTFCNDLLRNRMANELCHECVPVILHEDDLNAMYYGIENRSPFLDTELYTICQSIPTRHLIQNGRAKAVLREAVRTIAPDVIVDNPRKVGFNVPLFDYLDVENPIVHDELLSDGVIFDLVKREEIESLLSYQQLSNSRSKFLFNFICAKFFLEESVDLI
ncbi:MAG: asparagine synthase (glutamine-hydrolyzing) [Cyanobacteria bacterium LVE1205-1]